ncbi:hypothetical protein QQF64_006988 [Cirrhinus molitorella]|uniref:Uncharacterized protein n=1 Tax=Cirrhinus molitorella TaxID=172907 RepID=A0ABR3MDF8_9TELE
MLFSAEIAAYYPFLTLIRDNGVKIMTSSSSRDAGWRKTLSLRPWMKNSFASKAKMRFLVLFFFLVEMQWIPAGRCVTMPVWFTVCKAGYYLEAPAAQIVMPSNGGGEVLQAQSLVKMPVIK